MFLHFKRQLIHILRHAWFCLKYTICKIVDPCTNSFSIHLVESEDVSFIFQQENVASETVYLFAWNYIHKYLSYWHSSHTSIILSRIMTVLTIVFLWNYNVRLYKMNYKNKMCCKNSNLILIIWIVIMALWTKTNLSQYCNWNDFKYIFLCDNSLPQKFGYFIGHVNLSFYT